MNKIVSRKVVFIIGVLLSLNVLSLYTIYRNTHDLQRLNNHNKNIQNKYNKDTELLSFTIHNLMKSIELNGIPLKNIIVNNSSGAQKALYSLILDTTIIYNYADNGCQTCLIDELQRLKVLREKSSLDILCITNFESLREFQAFIKSYKLENMNFYNVESAIIDKKYSGYHLIIKANQNGYIEKCFIPDKIHPHLNEQFCNLLIGAKHSNKCEEHCCHKN